MCSLTDFNEQTNDSFEREDEHLLEANNVVEHKKPKDESISKADQLVENFRLAGSLALANESDKQIVHEAFSILGKEVINKFEKNRDSLTVWEKISSFVKSLFGYDTKVYGVNGKDEFGSSLIHYLFASKEVLEYAHKDLNADIKSLNGEGSSVAMLATRYGKIESMKYALDNGVDINHRDLNGATLLHECVLYHNSKANRDLSAVLKEALARGADLSIKGREPGEKEGEGKTPLELAEQLGRKDLVDIIKEHEISVKKNTREAILEKYVNTSHGVGRER
jgi:hypothetical protein